MSSAAAADSSYTAPKPKRKGAKTPAVSKKKAKTDSAQLPMPPLPPIPTPPSSQAPLPPASSIPSQPGFDAKQMVGITALTRNGKKLAVSSTKTYTGEPLNLKQPLRFNIGGYLITAWYYEDQTYEITVVNVRDFINTCWHLSAVVDREKTPYKTLCEALSSHTHKEPVGEGYTREFTIDETKSHFTITAKEFDDDGEPDTYTWVLPSALNSTIGIESVIQGLVVRDHEYVGKVSWAAKKYSNGSL